MDQSEYGPASNKELRRLARRIGMWAGVGFLLSLLATAAVLGIARVAFEAIADSNARSVSEKEAIAEALVGQPFRDAAAAYISAVDQEQKAAQQGRRAFETAKADVAKAGADLSAKATTQRERELEIELSNDPGYWESCVDVDVYGPYPMKKLKDCKIRDIAAMRSVVQKAK